MKIDGLITSAPEVKRNKSGAVSDFSFQRVLESRFKAPAGIEDVAQTTKVGEPGAASAQTRLNGLTVTETTLDAMESFSHALGNTNFSADDLEPYASALEEHTLALLTIKDRLPENDHLAKLLDRVATVSFVESTKFRRGDYSV
ncbi:MAG: hypothetical protein KAI90_03320 [Desulfobulbaceae bacterium]|nr:hypothetical protein [Desulfobulbaceae bacterium]